MHDLVPFFLEQPGVDHPSSSARTVAWAASAGQRGVVGSGSYGVVAQAVPNGSVQVRRGAAVIPSTYPGALCESYVTRNRTNTNVPIRPTGSGGPRTDAIIVRIDDTGLAGQVPTDLTSYEFSKVQVIENVSAGLWQTDALNLPYPALLLATVTIPASTGTITQAMITDRRRIACARDETVQLSRALVASDAASNALVLSSGAAFPQGEWFPNRGGAQNNGSWQVDVPAWATLVQIRAEWHSVAFPPKCGRGMVWVTWGPDGGSTSPTRYTQGFGWDADHTADTYRQTLAVVQELPVAAALRGTVQPFILRGMRTDTAKTGKPLMDGLSGVSLELRFLERPDTDLQAD